MRIQGRIILNIIRSFPALRHAETSAIVMIPIYIVFSLVVTMLLPAGCVSDKVNQDGTLFYYQQILADRGPQQRIDAEGQDVNQPLGLLRQLPSEQGMIPDVEFAVDPNTGGKVVHLTIEEVLARSLANSPEIRVVSFEPSIAKEDITKAAAEFDVTAFGELNLDNEDDPANSIYQSGQSDERTFETGIKQKNITGLEWTLSYAMKRNWDDLSSRVLTTRYEPILNFRFRQPLLRDAWQNTNLAGVDVAKINYKISLLDFRRKAEEVAGGVISAYWSYYLARQNVEVYRQLLGRTIETLEKVKGRKDIDATEVHIKQTEASIKAREATLLQYEKLMNDAQDVLTRLMADPKFNVLEEFEIIPVTLPPQEIEELEISKLLETAMQNNPVVQQARMNIEIADIKMNFAENQYKPRLDLIASARAQGIGGGPENAHDQLMEGDYLSYGVGLSLEYPIGNRLNEAELIQKRIGRRRAVAVLQNLADQAAQMVKERARRIKTNYKEMLVQKEAVDAAFIQLEVLKDTEEIREKLTPEFILLKLQAQESLATAQASHIRSIVDFNIAMTELSQTLGTVLELTPVESSIPKISDNDAM